MTYLLDYENVKKNLKLIKTTIDGRTENSITYSSQAVTTSWVDVLGSEISYTPLAGSNYVIYEFNTAISWDTDSRFYTRFKLQFLNNNTYSDIVSNNTNYYASLGGTNPTTSPSYSDATYKTSDTACISFRVPIWSGEKTLVLRCKTDSTSFNGRVNRFKGVSGIYNYNPFILCYCI